MRGKVWTNANVRIVTTMLRFCSTQKSCHSREVDGVSEADGDG
jgi:hypothetical protein